MEISTILYAAYFVTTTGLLAYGAMAYVHLLLFALRYLGKRVTRLYVRHDQPVRVSTLIGERADWSPAVTDYLRQRDAGEPEAR